MLNVVETLIRVALQGDLALQARDQGVDNLVAVVARSGTEAHEGPLVPTTQIASDSQAAAQAAACEIVSNLVSHRQISRAC